MQLTGNTRHVRSARGSVVEGAGSTIMKLVDHMCIVPFGGSGSNRDRQRSRSRDRAPPHVEGGTPQDEDEFVRGSRRILLNREQTERLQQQPNNSRKEPSMKKPPASPAKSPLSSSSKKDSSTSSSKERITFSRLISIFRDAYITTMKSFASKPGGLGGMAIGGNIDLPDATPSRTFREPRNFVRSLSKRRPDYISSPAPDYANRVQSDFEKRVLPGGRS